MEWLLAVTAAYLGIFIFTQVQLSFDGSLSEVRKLGKEFPDEVRRQALGIRASFGAFNYRLILLRVLQYRWWQQIGRRQQLSRNSFVTSRRTS